MLTSLAEPSLADFQTGTSTLDAEGLQPQVEVAVLVAGVGAVDQGGDVGLRGRRYGLELRGEVPHYTQLYRRARSVLLALSFCGSDFK